MKLKELVGLVGSTAEVEFRMLLDKVNKEAEYQYEIIEELALVERVIEIHKDKKTSELYALTYDVRTPDSPTGMDFQFMFGSFVDTAVNK